MVLPLPPRIFHSLLAQPQQQALKLCKGTVSGLWKMVGIPTGHVSPQCIVTQGNPNLYLDQPITKGWSHVSYPTDSPTIPRLGLRSSPHCCLLSVSCWSRYMALRRLQLTVLRTFCHLKMTSSYGSVVTWHVWSYLTGSPPPIPPPPPPITATRGCRHQWRRLTVTMSSKRPLSTTMLTETVPIAELCFGQVQWGMSPCGYGSVPPATTLRI